MRLSDKRIIGRVCRVVVFCLVLGVVMRLTAKVLWMQDDTYTVHGFEQFYDLPENTVDVMTLGASGMREFYNCNEAYAYNGLACMTLATSGQPFIANKYLMMETERTQHPKVYFIEVRQLENNDDGEYANCLRKVVDAMHFSRNRIDLINRGLEINAEIHPDEEINKIDYFFSYFLYHSRWDELSKLDYGQYSDIAWMGFSIFSSIDEEPQDEAPETIFDHESRPLTDSHLEELNEVLDYCKQLHETQGTEFLFVDSIAWREDRHYERGNTIKQIVEDAGFTFIDTRVWFNEMGFDLNNDFRDSEHVNIWGSFKYTHYLADYLKNTYGLEDHRGDSKYAVWQENYEGFKAAYDKMEAERAAAAAEAEE